MAKKRYTTWSDETSGIGGRNRPTTYGVYDNLLKKCVYPENLASDNKDYTLAVRLASDMNAGPESKSTLEIDPDYRTAIHFKPSTKTDNVKCLNGSAHVHYSFRIEDVNCTKCLDETDKDQEHWWDEFFTKNSK